MKIFWQYRPRLDTCMQIPFMCSRKERPYYAMWRQQIGERKTMAAAVTEEADDNEEVE